MKNYYVIKILRENFFVLSAYIAGMKLFRNGSESCSFFCNILTCFHKNWMSTEGNDLSLTVLLFVFHSLFIILIIQNYGICWVHFSLTTDSPQIYVRIFERNECLMQTHLMELLMLVLFFASSIDEGKVFAENFLRLIMFAHHS